MTTSSDPNKQFPGQTGFPTPNAPPDLSGCRVFSVPSDEEWFALLMAAVERLTYEWAWFKNGTMTQAEAAAAWSDIIDNAVAVSLAGECSDTVPAPWWDEVTADDADDTAPVLEQVWYGEIVTTEGFVAEDSDPVLSFTDNLGIWLIAGFIAYSGQIAGAIAFVPIAKRFVLAFKQNSLGGVVKALIDFAEVAEIDTYGVMDGVANLSIIMPDDGEDHTLYVMLSDENPHGIDNPSMTVLRKRLDESEVSPPNIRFTDTDPPVFQTTDDGGITWVDSPAADPRYNPANLLPPLTPYSGIECDVAARMTAQLKDTLHTFLEAGDAAQFATGVIALVAFPFGLAGWILDVLLFGFNVLIDIGQANIAAAFTDAVYDDIRCIFSCYIDGSGQISQSNLDAAYDQIEAAHAGVVASTIGELRFFFGDVAMSNAGVARDDTGDCSACPACDWIVEYDFTGGQTHGFITFVGAGIPRGAYVGNHFEGTIGGGVNALFVYKAMAGVEVTQASAFIDVDHGTGIGNVHRIFDVTVATNPPSTTLEEFGAVVDQTPAGWLVDGAAPFTTTEGWAIDWNCDTNGTGYVKLYKLRIAGTGTPPPDGVRVASLS